MRTAGTWSRCLFTGRAENHMALLHPGEKFPALTVALPGGGSLRLPEALDGHFGVVLFYRGSWCPYCNAHLRAFQRAKDSLARAGAKVVALSVHDEATTAEPMRWSPMVLKNTSPRSRSSATICCCSRRTHSPTCPSGACCRGGQPGPATAWPATTAPACGPLAGERRRR